MKASKDIFNVDFAYSSTNCHLKVWFKKIIALKASILYIHIRHLHISLSHVLMSFSSTSKVSADFILTGREFGGIVMVAERRCFFLRSFSWFWIFKVSESFFHLHCIKYFVDTSKTWQKNYTPWRTVSNGNMNQTMTANCKNVTSYSQTSTTGLTIL